MIEFLTRFMRIQPQLMESTEIFLESVKPVVVRHEVF